MDWLGKNFMSFNSIVHALESSISNDKALELPMIKFENEYDKVLIIGGGFCMGILVAPSDPLGPCWNQSPSTSRKETDCQKISKCATTSHTMNSSECGN